LSLLRAALVGRFFGLLFLAEFLDGFNCECQEGDDCTHINFSLGLKMVGQQGLVRGCSIDDDVAAGRHKRKLVGSTSLAYFYRIFTINSHITPTKRKIQFRHVLIE